MTDHELLIEKLSQQALPVKRPWPDGWRALAWTLMALPSGWLSSLLLQRVATDWAQSGAFLALLQLGLTFVMGVLAIRNAFLLSIPGRRPLSWKGFMPLLVLWLGCVLANLGQTSLTHHRDEVNCYVFMMTVSAPMMLLAIGYLRRTRSLHPLQSLATAGAGVACMALTLLSFCHPVEVHPLDFALHLAAIFTIVVATVGLGWKWVAIPLP
ncbi:DUF1109 domain-containing protein [Lelliottia sp. JS-SCA-14]|uniref:DUF1109 domain-containing protein n=1 Tax=Lelliottia sp. JS-SCA-14 TaxID=3110110 RepID=UPI002D7A391F|nr:DUF1109 domain-containing protein [Lelliottia sp. JS-SCA-14]